MKTLLNGLPVAVEHPAVLLLLPLVALAWWWGWRRHGLAVLPVVAFSSLNLAPAQPLGRCLAVALQGCALLALLALVVALASPYRPAEEVEVQGRGAEIMLLLDRSRSMDQSMVSGAGAMRNFNMNYGVTAAYSEDDRRTKAEVARQVLSEFAARRASDRFGVMFFSTQPLLVLPFTHKPQAIAAAIAAGAVGRGVADTDIGAALIAGAEAFRDRRYMGSRVLLLVSDGGDHLEPGVRERFAHLAKQMRLSIVWIYLRSAASPGLMADADAPPEHQDAVPEYFLHRYLQDLGQPYRAYEADNPEALAAAIADVGRLQNLPIAVTDTVQRRPLTGWFVGFAALALAVWCAARLIARRVWVALRAEGASHAA